MIAKLGVVVAALLLGFLVFVAGTLAPDSIRDAITTATSTLMNRVVDPSPADSPQSDPKSATEGDAAPRKDKDDKKPIPYKQLMVGEPARAKAQYALEVGHFPDQQSAEPWVRRLEDLGYSAQVIPVVDKSGVHRLVLAAGKYASRDAARSARAAVSRDLGLPLPLTLIQLPGDKKADRALSEPAA